jgi:hypothetical protein
MPVIGADAGGLHLAFKIWLQVFGIGFAILLNSFSLRFMLQPPEISLIGRIRWFPRLFLLPFCIISIAILVLIPRTGITMHCRITEKPAQAGMDGNYLPKPRIRIGGFHHFSQQGVVAPF